MSLYSSFDPARLNADVTLRHACAAVLQKALVKTAVLVDLRYIPFTEVVGADVSFEKQTGFILEVLTFL